MKILVSSFSHPLGYALRVLNLLAVVLLNIAGTLQAYDLRCESLTDPLAIDSTTPQLSWKLKSRDQDSKNLSQSGYRILVASSPKLLDQSKPDLWDSGIVKSSSTFGVKYNGKPLGSRSHCWWKIEVLDQNGGVSTWTAPAMFAIGLLDPSDWKGDWIHGEKPLPASDNLSSAQWIWDSADARSSAPEGSKKFRRTFVASKGESARIILSADDQFVVRLNNKVIAKSSGEDSWRRPTTVELTDGLLVGENHIEVEVTNSSPSPAGLLAALELRFHDQINVTPSDEKWTVGGSPAVVLGKNGISPWGKISLHPIVEAPAQYFGKEFVVSKPVRRATAFVTALGIVDFAVNGKRVTEDLFTPGWTDYAKRTYYRAFDVTNLIRTNSNSISAVLGQGWYAGYVAWGAQRNHWGDTPMLRAQVEVEYADGSSSTIATGPDWSVGRGPIRDEHFLHGEKYDARFPIPSVSSNRKMAEVAHPTTSLEAFPGSPVSSYKTLTAKSVTEVRPGVYLLNYGQNLSGFVRLSVREKAGTKIVIRHGERLDAKGQLYTDNLRLAQATDSYTCSGVGTEVWNPRFTFHGFQYIEVSGLTKAPSKSAFKAIAISSSTPESGTLVTSDPMLNKLVSNAWWTQKMNFVDIPTDCPQRDERLGWTGDAQAYVRTATYFSDVQPFFNKWLVALDDSQRSDGQYPQVAPVLAGLADGGPAWADAGVICPMTIYDVYGDKEMLARHYPQMKKFIEFCRARSKANLLPPDQYHCFGDWLNIGANTPNDVITQSYFAGSTALVARAAHELKLYGEEAYYKDLHQRIKEAFVKAYVTPDGRVKGDTQCSYVLALGFDLLDAKIAKLAGDHLIKDIEKRDWHLSTGFVGTRDLLHVLSKIGRNDVAYRLLHNTTFPSWGFPIKNGATSIWERWDGWTPDKGFQDAGMNSFAHYAYGAVAGWMFKTIGGISESEPGYGRIVIAPAIDPNLSLANTVYQSVRGPIKVSWTRQGKAFNLSVDVPPNVAAEVRVPSVSGKVTSHLVGSGHWEF